MATLKLTFPGGRYHATPTGHHVNEGLVEWPPSPWRLVRALVATGYATQGWSALPPVARSMLAKLCAVLPEYRLPPGALGHSRHYMPVGVLDKGREKTTLVFDAFADVGNAPLWVRWPTVLADDEATLFGELVSKLGYLGRSESWVLGEAVADEVLLRDDGRAFPHVEGAGPQRGFEQVTLVAPEDPDRYRTWRATEEQTARAALASDGKKPTSAKLKAHEKAMSDAYPLDVLDGLQWDTARWQAARWSQAPASRRVLYWRPARALEVAPASRPSPTRTSTANAVLYALTSPSGSRTALPPLARTVPQGELFHRALVSRSGRVCAELSGRGDDGAPLKGHAHAHVIPLDLDADSHLDHILLHVPCGLSGEGLRAALSIKRTFTKGGVGDLRVAVAGHGELDDLRAMGDVLGRSIDALLGAATTWVSAVPFVPPRYLKKRGKHTLQGQVAAELAARGYPAAQVEWVPWSAEYAHLRHVIRYRSRQRGAPQPPQDIGFVLRLQFEEPVRGPLCLGYASHFGLGRFRAVDHGGAT